MYSYKDTHSTIAPPIFLLIASILGAIVVIVSIGTEYIKIYSVITVSAYVNIVYK